MAKKGFTLDDAIFQKKIRDLAKRVGVDEKDFVREQGALLLRDIAKYVPPYQSFPTGRGTSIGSAKDKKQGELAIEYDLRKIFFMPDKAQVYKWAKDTYPTGQIYRGREIIGAGVADTLEKMRRFHRSQQRRTGRTRALKGSEQMWVTPANFNKYLRAEKLRVGIAKASVAKGMIRLNPAAKIPAWVRRNLGNASGNARMAKLGGSWSAIFSASAFGLQHVQQKTMSIIKRARLKAMEKRLLFIMKDNAKKSGLKVR